MNTVAVAAGILFDPQGRVLLGQRPASKVYAGYWEFPGGKVESGESLRQALDRELKEELGIDVTQADPWMTQQFDYPHARVRIRFFRVTAWQGELTALEHSALAWQHPGAFDLAPMLPANTPMLAALTLPAEYAISQSQALGEAVFLAALEQRLQGGLRLLQLREPLLAPSDWPGWAAGVIERCHAKGAQVLVNSGAPAIVHAMADGLHLRAVDLMRCRERPAARIVGASCHDAAELAQAARIGADFALIGPVLATPSHPGQNGIGWPEFGRLADQALLPVYAIGGLRSDDLPVARTHGAHGLALLSAAWRMRSAISGAGSVSA